MNVKTAGLIIIGNEILSGSDPIDSSSNFVDSDNDGLGDDFEKNNGLDPNNSKDALVVNNDSGKSKTDELISNYHNGSDKSSLIITSNNSESNSSNKSVSNNDTSSDESRSNTSIASSNKSVSNTDTSSDKSSSITSVSSSNKSATNNVNVSNPSKSNSFTFASNDVLYYFEFGSSYINTNDKILNRLVKELKSSSKKIILIGHTDNIGDDYINLEISKSRANSVYQFLINKGVNKNLLSIEGFGEDRPLNNNSNSNQRALNRRVEIILN